MSKLYFRYGAMNSGKSTQLLQVKHNYESIGKRVILMKPKIDTKGNDMIVSRLGVSAKVDYLIEADDNIFDYVKEEHLKSPISCILIDEIQFATEYTIDSIFCTTVELQIPIICYGLRTDFKGAGFDGSQRLLSIAHSIQEIKTICACGKKALFGARYVNGKFTLDGELILIDGVDKNVEYKGLCGECFLKESKITQNQMNDELRSMRKNTKI